ncbi:U3 small nucleolar ribonucleoprotein protein MPP10 [Plodia interpunctella]|uniref:U3 small nucleolar ribonucleoprotein protein MPP10 n=1 Tax=Plodia interpunctella TaxID=58824 RepID=UPI0023686227|nr:U3 small nucleolar ribonucleoprotein protein MPP10 [Plodia interpunctella]
MATTHLKSFIDKFDGFTQKPVNYLVIQDGIKDDIKNLVKNLYDYTKSEENNKKKKRGSALTKLIVEGFDEEQIWQQLELQNSGCWDKLVLEVANCVSSKNNLTFPVKVNKPKNPEVEIDSDKSPPESVKDDSDQENIEAESEKTENESEKTKKSFKNESKKVKGSIVDDKFFKLKDMEKFLLNEEKKESGKKVSEKDSDEESIDLFDEDDEDSNDDEGGNNMMYTDFFDQLEGDEGAIEDEGNEYDEQVDTVEESEAEPVKSKPDKKKVKFAGLSSDDDSDESTEEPNKLNGKTESYEKKSEFEQRQQRLQQTIARLEEKSLKEAPWQLKGEVDAAKRPQNSLLEEVVDFDMTSRPPPLITEQTTLTLEDIIKQRVKDKAWDDVEKKEKPVDDQLSFRKTKIIDQSKSKLSLAQVYEAEYLKQKQALSGEVEEEKEPESHTEIRESMSKLFAKLNALCNYHYTPKAPQAEVKIVTNTPAISMEEVAPVATSDAALLAPEEVKKKQKGDLISKEERTQTDKNRERRKKKKLQRLKGKVMKVTEHRNTKKGVESNDKSLKTSKAFFQQLNDEAGSLIKSKKAKNKGQ